jgi:hypothetical protein
MAADGPAGFGSGSSRHSRSSAQRNRNLDCAIIRLHGLPWQIRRELRRRPHRPRNIDMRNAIINIQGNRVTLQRVR